MAVSRQSDRGTGEASRSASYTLATWFYVILWVAVCTFTLGYNGPSPDEGLSVTSGLRTLEGHGFNDGYLSWLKGSLLWPTLAGLGYRVAGLMGSRYAALLIAAVALLAVAQGTKDIFGPRAGFWAAVSLSVSGSFLTLARLAVFDTLALAALGLAFWSITRLTVLGNRSWLGLTAGAYAVAVLSKYAAALTIIPLLWIILTLRDEKAKLDIGILLFLSFALAVILLLPNRQRFTSATSGQASVGEGLAALGKTVALSGYLGGIPIILGSAGFLAFRDKRDTTVAMLGSLALWPIYHVLSANSEDLFRHMAFASVLAYPVVGATLAWFAHRATSRQRLRSLGLSVYLLLIAGFGLVQVRQLSRSWPDVRDTAAFLLSRVEPGQRLLIDPAWPYAMYLYGEAKVDSPWAIYDSHRLEETPSTQTLCTYDYFVDLGNYSGWAEQTAETARQCEDTSEVFTTRHRAVSFGSSLRYVDYPVRVSVWSPHGHQ